MKAKKMMNTHNKENVKIIKMNANVMMIKIDQD
jgi:hypothetical protein